MQKFGLDYNRDNSFKLKMSKFITNLLSFFFLKNLNNFNPAHKIVLFRGIIGPICQKLLVKMSKFLEKITHPNHKYSVIFFESWIKTLQNAKNITLRFKRRLHYAWQT